MTTIPLLLDNLSLFSELVKAAKKKGSHGDDIAKSMEVFDPPSVFLNT